MWFIGLMIGGDIVSRNAGGARGCSFLIWPFNSFHMSSPEYTDRYFVCGIGAARRKTDVTVCQDE
jgi:hypothetical protein